jgi:hypothetical protein
MNVKRALSRLRWLSAAGVLAIAAVSTMASPAAARSSFRFSLFVPLYAGPPAFYSPPAFFPAPVYSYPPPVYFVPAPPVFAPVPRFAPAPPIFAPRVFAPAPRFAPRFVSRCSTGRWRRSNGSVVFGTACRRPNGTWRLAR